MALWPVGNDRWRCVVRDDRWRCVGREMTARSIGNGIGLYPDSFASPGDFPLSGAVEISRLRFTSLEMTESVVSVGMTDGVVSFGNDGHPDSGVVSFGMTPFHFDGVVSVGMTDGVVSVGNDRWRCVGRNDRWRCVRRNDRWRCVVRDDRWRCVGKYREIDWKRYRTVSR